METSFDPKFWPSVGKLAPADSHRIVLAIGTYQKNPAAPGLNLEKLQGSAGRKRLHSIRASDELRILLALEGPTSVFLRAGHHDRIYALAERASFVAPRAGSPGLIGVTPNALDLDGTALTPGRAPAASREAADEGPPILQHWSHGELGRAGFSEPQIALLRRATQDTLLDIWPDIPEDRLDRVLECSEQSPEEYFQTRLITDTEAEHKRFRDAIVERGALAGLSSLLDPEEVQRLLSAPIEDWMIFLHPEQRALVERSFRGPARVRGSAGTGKTVVALHRAAILAKRFIADPVREAGRPPVLFTTFIRSLPPVLANLYRRLPAAVPGAVEFLNVDKLAHRICTRHDQRPALRPDVATGTFQEAFDAIVQRSTPLDRARVTRSYLREEVDAVLKGRDVDSLEEYLSLERTGRRTPFTAPMREQVWDLRTDWDRRLREAGIVDFPDVVRRARDLALRHHEPMYRAAIVDESQDLSLVGLQLVRALVGGASGQSSSDALFITGDGAQKIYPGGFTLAHAGLDVRGRSFVLRVNYRNTRQIIDAAMACAGSAVVDDFGDEYVRGSAEARTVESGVRPRLVRTADFGTQIAHVADRIGHLSHADSLSQGDIGVLAATNKLVNRVIGDLQATGLRCQPLTRFDGRHNDRIKVGTFHRAKGLEFKVAFLLGLSEGGFPRPPGPRQGAEEYEEFRSRQLSELFVAMTRARDALFLLCSREPSAVLYEALDHLDEEDHSR